MKVALAIICFLLCIFSSVLQADALIPKKTMDLKTYKYAFTKQDHFVVEFADYPQGEEDFYELLSTQDAILPAHIIPKQQGLEISGNNHSDDLFMYAYKELEGLKPNTRYQVSFSLEFASNAPKNLGGVGGAPGDSVFVKIGAVNKPPERYIDTQGYYRMSLDKGNQGSDGREMLIIGTIGVDTHDALYRLKTLPYQPDGDMEYKLEHYQVTTDTQGHVWLILGTDSGYESTSTLFYTNVIATFKEQ